jgi:hypothetical protein
MISVKGPWMVKEEAKTTYDIHSGIPTSNTNYFIHENDGQTISVVVGYLLENPSKVANLIAAAPEILEALELFKNYEGSRDNEGLRMLGVAHEKAKAAIKKAKGEL